MSRISYVVLGAAIVTSAFISGRAFGEGEGEGPAPAVVVQPKQGPIVFINLDRVFRESADGQALMNRLRLNAELHDKSMTERADKLKKAIQDLRASIQADTPEFRREWRSIEARKWELDYDDREGRDELNRVRVDGMLAIHKQVRALCEQLVEENGWTAVQQYDPEGVSARAPNGDPININELSLQVATRPVLAIHPDNDITALVLQRMGK